MIIELKKESPLYNAFKANELALVNAINLMAEHSAKKMGKEFNNVYRAEHRNIKVNKAA